MALAVRLKSDKLLRVRILAFSASADKRKRVFDLPTVAHPVRWSLISRLECAQKGVEYESEEKIYSIGTRKAPFPSAMIS